MDKWYNSYEEYENDMLDRNATYDDPAREAYDYDCSDCPWCGGSFYDVQDHLEGCEYRPDEDGWSPVGRRMLEFHYPGVDHDWPAMDYRPAPKPTLVTYLDPDYGEIPF